MKSLKGSKTEKNLLTAFAGESQARNRYMMFSKKAKDEGYEQIAAFFLETADNEYEHAKRFFKCLEGGEIEVSAAFPAGVIGTTAENLKAAAAGENYEHSKMYPEFAAVAEEEGYNEIALLFKNISKIEIQHEKRYLKLLDNINKGQVFKKENIVKWKCRKCGFVHEGKEAPQKCPFCTHPQAYFELFIENY